MTDGVFKIFFFETVKHFYIYQKIKLILISVFLALTGCAGNATHYFGNIDPLQKTIATPSGYKGIVGPIKNVLTEENWKVDEYNLVPTRYKLSVNTIRAELLCWNEFSEVSYEIFLVDVKTGKEVFALTGESCDSFNDVATEFRKALRDAERENP